VAAAPAYVERFGRPLHPGDLLAHRGVRIRIGDDRLYRWEFERDGEELAIDVPGALTVDQGQIALGALRQGAALMYAPDFMVARDIAAGALTTVLDDWVAPGPGFHIYHSSRRQVPAALRLFADHLRELRPLGL
jgi:DNA-binding transcriptional LysR family regulator